MTLIGKLDQLNQAEDRIKLAGPGESNAPLYTGAWVYENDIRDSIEDADTWLTDGDAYQKAQSFDDYTEMNDEHQLLEDLQASHHGDFWTVYIKFTPTDFYGEAIKYDSRVWQRLIDAFGKAAIWDKLVNSLDTETLMNRLGYHYDEEEPVYE